MSQARLITGARSRVFERSATTQLNSRQHLKLRIGICGLYHTSVPSALRYGRLSNNGHHHVANRSIPIPFSYAHSLSTNAPQTSTSTTSKPTEPPPPAASSKKTKVELRPGPTKSSINATSGKPSGTSTTQQHAVQPQASSSEKPHPTKPPPLSATSPKEDVLKEAEGKGVIDIAKKDMADAARHGILAPPPADASMFGRLFHQAKELFKFYWAGLKFIFTHRKEVRRIQERVKSGGAPLTWKEHRFILTNRSDMIKLVPFLLTIIIIEEIIPLIVIYIPGMLPSTCVLPSQRERIEAKRHERQREAYTTAKATGIFKDIHIEQVQLNLLGREEMSILCNTIGITSLGPLGTRRLKKYLRKIAAEDGILLSEGRGAKLKQVDIATALCDRGFLAQSYTPSQQRDRLRWWLASVKEETSAASGQSPEDIRARLLVLMLREARL